MGFRSLLWACVLGLLGITVSRGVDLNQGQPKTFNLVLAIRGEEGLREENPAEVIEGIKEVFEEATRELFEALDRRVALGQLTVLVPLEWKEVAAKNVQIPAEELYADIQLEYNRNGYGDFPWTLQGSLCGSQGTFVSLTPAFVKNPEILAFQECGSRGRLVAMEVIKYHYGVFDERGCSGEGISVVSDPVLINGERGWRTRENRCPGTWTSNRISSSLMQGEFQRLYSGSWATAPVAEKASDRPLCSRKSHDVTLMHAQNVFCGGRSMWEVLETHSDFRSSPAPSPAAPPFRLELIRAEFPIESSPLQLEARFAIHEGQNGEGNAYRLPMFQIIAFYQAKPITGLMVRVRIRYLHAVSGEHTELFQALDDGVVPDLRPNDGIYTLSVTSEKPGPFQFVVEVEGTNVKLNGGLFGGVNSCNSMINSCRPTTLIETNFNVAVASEPQFGTFPIPTPDTLPPPHVTELKIVGRNVELACSYYLSWQAIQSHGAKHFGYHIRCAHSSTSLFSEPCFVAQLPDQGHRAFNNLEYSYEVPPGFCLGSVVCNIRAVSLINGVPGQMTFAAGFCLPPEGVVEEDSLVSSGTYQRAVSEQKNNELPIPHPVYRRSRELGMVPWRAWRRSREWSIERPLNDEVNFISGRSVNSDARPFEQVIVNKWFELKPNRQPNWQMYNSTSNAIALEWLERKWMLRNHVTEDDDEDGVISGEGPDGVELEGRDAADHYYVRRRSSHPLWGYRRKYYLHYGTQWGIFTVACFFFLSASVGCLSTVWCFYTMPPPDEPFFRREKLIVGPDGRSSRALTTTFADPLLMHGSQSCNDRGYIRSLQFFLPFCSGLLKDDDNSCNNQNGQGEGETNVC